MFRNCCINDVSRNFLAIWKKKHKFYFLRALFSFCITPGANPNVFKFAQNTSMHLKGSIHNISTYRPLSVPSNLSKVYENIIYNNLQRFCQTFDFHAENNFGFRKKKLIAELAAVTLMDILSPAFVEKKYGTCFFSIILLASTHIVVQYFMIN